MKENYYEILHLPNFSSSENVKKNYKDLIKQCHPDKGGDPELFDKIKKSYEILKECDTKNIFDKKLKCIIFNLIFEI